MVKRRYQVSFSVASQYLGAVSMVSVFFHTTSSKDIKSFLEFSIKLQRLRKTLQYSFAVYKDNVFAFYRVKIVSVLRKS